MKKSSFKSIFRKVFLVFAPLMLTSLLGWYVFTYYPEKGFLDGWLPLFGIFIVLVLVFMFFQKRSSNRKFLDDEYIVIHNSDVTKSGDFIYAKIEYSLLWDKNVIKYVTLRYPFNTSEDLFGYKNGRYRVRKGKLCEIK